MKKIDWLSRKLLKNRPGGQRIVNHFDNGDLCLKDILDYGNNQASEGYDAGYQDGLNCAEMEKRHGRFS